MLLPEEPEPVTALGIDETRRGRPRYGVDPQTGTTTVTADRWHTGFVDLTGGHGLLGQVEGRTAGDAGAWLAARDPAWRAGVAVVAIDMCPAYRAAVREHLPHATLVVDHFHVVQLANRPSTSYAAASPPACADAAAAPATPSTASDDGCCATART